MYLEQFKDKIFNAIFRSSKFENVGILNLKRIETIAIPLAITKSRF